MNLNNEKGAVLVVSLIIMGLLMVIGTSITMTSSIELNIARNEKVAQSAFYKAENGRILASRVIRSVFSGLPFSNKDEYETGSGVWVTDGDFPFEGIGDTDTYSGASAAPDVRVGTAGSPLAADPPLALVDVDKVSVGPLPGSSAEFASGYEGAGKAGSTQVIYQIESEGQAGLRAKSLVTVEYRMLP